MQFALAALLLALFAACAPLAPSPPPTLTPYLEQTATPIPIRAIVAEPTATATLTVQPTATATYTPKPTGTSSPAPTITATAIPTTRVAPTATPVPATRTPTPAVIGCPQGCTEHKAGCDIKGNISGTNGDKIYHVPGGRYYTQTVIDSANGERWFCTEAEATANGWRKSKQ